MKTEQLKDAIDKFFEWKDQFKTVRVIEQDNRLIAKKIAIIDGVEQEYGIDYDIMTFDGEPMPNAGDYPISHFEELVVAANVYPQDFQAEITPHKRHYVLIYNNPVLHR